MGLGSLYIKRKHRMTENKATCISQVMTKSRQILPRIPVLGKLTHMQVLHILILLHCCSTFFVHLILQSKFKQQTTSVNSTMLSMFKFRASYLLIQLPA